LYTGRRLDQAEEWEGNSNFDLSPLEQEFLDASKARATRDRRQKQLTRIAAMAAVAVVVVVLSGWLIIQQRNQATLARNRATYAQLRDDAANAKAALQPELAEQKLREANAIFPDLFDLDVEIDSVRRDVANAWFNEAKHFKADLQPEKAIIKLEAADGLYPDQFDLEAEINDVRRFVATEWAHQGEEMVKTGDFEGATTKFGDAINLDPPPDTLVYVWVEPGEFRMGYSNEEQSVNVDGFWIGRTEVTNAQYIRCVEDKVCDPPNNQRYETPNLANHPVTDVTWYAAKSYSEWVGGRLPTEVEWEKGCSGTDGRIYPWGDEEPTYERLNFDYTVGSTSQVGSYPAGAYGLYDMAGNVWEWTNSQYRGYPYDVTDGREASEGDDPRTLRGGSWDVGGYDVRCANRGGGDPGNDGGDGGFRVIFSSPG